MLSEPVILLVDDDDDDLFLLETAIRRIIPGAVIHKANDCLEAGKTLSVLQPGIPDILFLDINMPKINGLEFLQNLRQTHQLDNTRIIIYSTGRYENQMKKCESLGALYCVKPSNYHDLIAMLHQIFDLHEE